VPSILADVYWEGSPLSEILMILFTQSTALLHKYLMFVTIFSLRLHRIPREFPEFSKFREIPKYSRFSRFVAPVLLYIKTIHSGISEIAQQLATSGIKDQLKERKYNKTECHTMHHGLTGYDSISKWQAATYATKATLDNANVEEHISMTD